MIRFILSALVIVLIFCFISCATSMSPIEVNNTLPSLTKSTFISGQDAVANVASDECKFLVKGRSYIAPIGLTPKNDLRGAAKGIDEWVQLDGGNAYVLTNFKWVSVGNDYDTELHVEFDTMLCK